MKKIFARVFTVLLTSVAFLLLMVQGASAATVSRSSFADTVTAAAKSQLAAVVAATANATSSQAMLPETGSTYTDQERIALTQPGLVRIVTHITGTSTIPAFVIDLDTGEYSASTNTSDQPLEVPDDEYITGTGFVISPDGYIATASHVVTDQDAISSLASDVVSQAIQDEIDALSDAKYAALMAQYPTSAEQEAYGQELAVNGIKYLRGIMTSYNVQVYIAEPTAATTTQVTDNSAYISQIADDTDAQMEQEIQTVVANSIPATIAYKNDSYLDDEKDVAILKVAETNLPDVRLDGVTLPTAGDQIFVFGYPGNSDLSGFSTTPTYTTGTVSALRNSTLNTFQYIQTDAKIAPGSSGGPLFNQSGTVIGIIDESTATDDSGDNFGFAVPLSLLSSAIASIHISTSTPNDYVSSLSAGLTLLSENHCKAALKDFAVAESANTVFGDPKSFVDPYVSQCNALIAAGKSDDGLWDSIEIWFQEQPLGLWIAAGIALIVIIGAAIGIFYLVRLLRKEEKAISDLTQHAQEPQVQPQPQTQPTTPVVPEPQPQTPPPTA